MSAVSLLRSACLRWPFGVHLSIDTLQEQTSGTQATLQADPKPEGVQVHRLSQDPH